MQIPILVEPVAGNGYRAVSALPASLTGEGATKDEAVANLRAQIAERLRGGAEVLTLDFPASGNPLAQFAGVFKDNPGVDDWLNDMGEYRQRIDRE